MARIAQWRRLQDLGLQLLDETGPSALVRASLDALLEIVPGEVVGQIDIDPRGGGASFTERPERLLTSADTSVVHAALATHPALSHLRTSPRLEASRVEDLCGEAAWQRHPLRRHLLAPSGVPYALLCGHITRSGRVRGWGVNRDRPFSDAEREALAGLEPFLRRAARAIDEQALVLDLDRAVADGAGVLVLRSGRTAYANAQAEALLDMHRVAAPALGRAVAGRRVDDVVVLETARGTLRVRMRPSAPGTLTLVLIGADTSDGSAQAPLTPRQQAVLCFLAEGLTADAMARHLGLSPRTVHKHLEHVYRRLSARDRLEAVLRAQELGLLQRCASPSSGALHAPV